MEKSDLYRGYIKQLLAAYAELSAHDKEIETQLVFDEQREHYQLLHVGWQHRHRIYGVVIHMDLKGEKIWIQHNGTAGDVAAELEAFGVPKEDIVLGFRSPALRPHTGYAVA